MPPSRFTLARFRLRPRFRLRLRLGGSGSGSASGSRSGSGRSEAVPPSPAGSAEAAASRAAEPETAAPEAPARERAAADLPVPGYDELSVASLRARLRTLDAAQVRELLDYERAHASRANVVTMFERRIAKLEGPEDADTTPG